MKFIGLIGICLALGAVDNLLVTSIGVLMSFVLVGAK